MLYSKLLQSIVATLYQIPLQFLRNVFATNENILVLDNNCVDVCANYAHFVLRYEGILEENTKPSVFCALCLLCARLDFTLP